MDGIGTALFAVLALGLVGGGLAVVLVNRITAAALFMAFTFLCNAGMFLLLGAEVIAMFQVIIYVGAITVLIIFGVMLTPQGDRRYGLFFQKQTPVAAIVLAAVAIPVVVFAFSFRDPTGAPHLAPGDLKALTTSIFVDYAVPFEIASILLLAAMVGAIVLVKRESDDAAGGER
ncbi:MAG: NADH-quinone oxidoreductase subunit J [Chloroflexi bacterium]|nr:NADH-quinone oxidoreductase subunit J [Chloroflexota bacterium]